MDKSLVGRVTPRHWPLVAVGAPSAVLAVALAVTLVLAAFGRSPIWPAQQLTLSEAIATVDDAEIVRLMSGGADLNARHGVRAGLLLDRPADVTPLEAAVLAGRGDLFERLVRGGASIDPSEWNRLRCLAEADDLADVLERHRPANAVMRCQ